MRNLKLLFERLSARSPLVQDLKLRAPEPRPDAAQAIGGSGRTQRLNGRSQFAEVPTQSSSERSWRMVRMVGMVGRAGMVRVGCGGDRVVEGPGAGEASKPFA